MTVPRNRENRPRFYDDGDLGAYMEQIEAERDRLEEDTRRLRAEIQDWLDKYAVVNEMRAAAEAERDRLVEALRNIDAIHQRVAAIIRLNAPAKAAWARDAIRLLAAVPVEEETP